MNQERKIENYLDDKPAMTTMDIAHALQLRPNSARRALRSLREQGKVRRTALHPATWQAMHSYVREAAERRVTELVKELQGETGMKLVKRGGRNGKGAPVFTVHMNVKLSTEQASAIRASGKQESTWIREAVQMRIDREHSAR